MHWIVATLALGSLVLGSLALGSLALGSLAVHGSALAGGGAGGEIGIGLTLAPGQQETSSGKVFHAARTSDPTTAFPPEIPSEQEQRSNHGTPTWADFQQLRAVEKLGAKRETHAAR
jgi:hypothetical protein